MGYIEYTHIDTNINSVVDFINQPFSIVAGLKEFEFINYKGDTDKTNRQRIEEMYIDNESYPLLKPNTKLLIKVDSSNRELVSFFGKDQILEQRDVNTFFASHLLRLITDKKYVKSEKYDIYKNLTVIEQYPTVSVWVWSRALNKIINVSNHIISSSIRVSKNVGNFSLELAPINDNGKILNQSTGLPVEYNRNYINESNLYVNEKRDKRNTFFYHKYIQANDIVFIKFEELEISNENRKNENFEISKSELANQVYDMIGLVDDNRQVIQPSNNDVSISVSGRDLMKLLIEDSDYFLPQLFAINSSDFYLSNINDNKLLKRNFVSGTYKNLFSFSYRKISESIQFIINQCAHLGIVPNELGLFDSYGDRRSQVYRVEEKNVQADIDIFNSLYLNKSTLGVKDDKKLFKPKSNKFSFENNTTLPKKQFNNYNKLSTDLHQGIWQIIKLEIDSSIDNRRIVDHSISQPDGNLISNISKICQEPFVEFFGDTYGDMYSFIVRQPPFTKDQIIKYLDSKISSEDGVINDQNLILEINDEDIITENLNYDDAGALSWYQMMPKELNIMNNNSILSYIPIVFLPEYAEIWGNRKLEIINNYASYESIRDKNQDVNLQIFIRSAVNDFKYIIESTMYLPFTRKGSIVINGDRRIKRGTWIRHNGTKELFYVDEIQNDFSISTNSIDRYTILQVSRGMVEKYIKGVEKELIDVNTNNKIIKNVSYFNIINTDIIRDVIIEKAVSTGENKIKDKYKTSFLVDRNIFNFFMKRGQFE